MSPDSALLGALLRDHRDGARPAAAGRWAGAPDVGRNALAPVARRVTRQLRRLLVKAPRPYRVSRRLDQGYGPDGCGPAGTVTGRGYHQ